jgi:hypothetical protein
MLKVTPKHDIPLRFRRKLLCKRLKLAQCLQRSATIVSNSRQEVEIKNSTKEDVTSRKRVKADDKRGEAYCETDD